MPGIYVVVGAPAVGKSTAARALCARHSSSVHIPVDDLRLMVVSGRVLPEEHWTDPLVAQVSLARCTALDMAARYRAAGFTVVIDDFLDPLLLREYDGLADDPDATRVILRPSQEEAHRRNLEREGESPYRQYIDGGIRQVYGVLADDHERLGRAGWRFVDTTRLTVEETVAAIEEHDAGSAG